MFRRTLLLFLTAGAQEAGAQSRPTEGATAGDALPRQSDYAFTRILSATALAGDLVLVIDSRETSASIIDLRTGTVRLFARRGAGPRELALPWRLITFDGDSAAIVDVRNARALVAQPDGSAGGFVRAPGAVDGTKLGANATSVRIDSRGTLYFERRAKSDSLLLLRLSADAKQMRRLGAVALTPLPSHLQPQTIGDGEVVMAAGSRGVPLDGFPYPGEQWEVAADGWIAIASRTPYRVSWIAPDGQRRDGRDVAVEDWPVTDATRREVAAERAREAPIRGGAAPDRFRWPEALPAFATGRSPMLLIDRKGRAWVRRVHRAEDEPLYDVFDRTGARIRQVRFARDERLVGFGAGAMLVAVRDADDLEAVRRIALRF